MTEEEKENDKRLVSTYNVSETQLAGNWELIKAVPKLNKVNCYKNRDYYYHTIPSIIEIACHKWELL